MLRGWARAWSLLACLLSCFPGDGYWRLASRRSSYHRAVVLLKAACSAWVRNIAALLRVLGVGLVDDDGASRRRRRLALGDLVLLLVLDGGPPDIRKAARLEILLVVRRPLRRRRAARGGRAPVEAVPEVRVGPREREPRVDDDLGVSSTSAVGRRTRSTARAALDVLRGGARRRRPLGDAVRLPRALPDVGRRGAAEPDRVQLLRQR
mmetsp:Transcript_15510/g.62448  ORF Transcript_15510/g.62448 Transcript_15510/m.62448 type:complete len:208 (+) Transcript_15510:114-737(+)